MAKPRNSQLSFDKYLDLRQSGAPQAASLDIDAVIRNGLTRALKESPLSRAEVAAKMTDLLFGDAGDREVTKAMIDAWTAPSREAWRFPLAYLPAFVEATGAVWLLEVIAARCGCLVLRNEHAAVLELGTLQAAKKRIASREAEIKKGLSPALYDELLNRSGGRS